MGDKNRVKGATLEKAKHYGMQTAKLPIAEHCTQDLGSFSKVLTVNHVAEILLLKSAGKQWSECFEAVMPKRRAGTGEPNARKKNRGGSKEQLAEPKAEDGDKAEKEKDDKE